MAAIYLDLDTAHDSIRLLDILPGEKNEPLRCVLRSVQLTDNPEYDALSYTWGDRAAEQEITVGSSKVLIQRTLASAMFHLRDRDNIRTLWADALCINQQDRVEKALQVSMMARIYTQCKQCLLWLGCCRDGLEFTLADVRAAFDMLQALAEYADIADRPTSEWRPASLRTSVQRKGAAKAIHGMLYRGNPWWNRIWTVQEAVLPTRKTLVWESLTFPWQTCYNAAKVWLNYFPITWFDTLAPEIDTHTIGLPFSVILGIEIAKDEAQVMPLFTLQRWRHRLAYDPRDKVYGLMGMFRSSNFPRIQCDYTLSPAKVFARMTLDLFDLSKSLLPLFGLRGEQQVTPNLPTWALDMVRPENPINTGAKFWEHYDRQFFFNADARKGQKDGFYEYTNDESTLKLKGICIDKVYQVDVGIEVDEDDRRPTDEFIATLNRRKQQWLELTTEKQIEEYPVLGVSLRDAFWQTMLGGVLTENERVTRLVSSADINLYEEYETNGRNNEAAETIQSMILNQAFFITDRGFVGIGPPCVKPGDSAWVVYGSSVPLFMRSSQKDSTYTWLGDGYVHGTMFGELVEASGTEWVELLIC